MRFKIISAKDWESIRQTKEPSFRKLANIEVVLENTSLVAIGRKCESKGALTLCAQLLGKSINHHHEASCPHCDWFRREDINSLSTLSKRMREVRKKVA